MSSPEELGKIEIRDVTPEAMPVDVSRLPHDAPMPHERMRAARREELLARSKAGELTVSAANMQNLQRRVETGEYKLPGSAPPEEKFH